MIFLGEVEIDFTTFEVDQLKYLKLPLKEKNGAQGQGELHLQLTYSMNK